MTLSPLWVTLILLIQNPLLQKFCQSYFEVVWQGYTDPEENKGRGSLKVRVPCVCFGEPNLIHSLELNTIQNGIWRDQNSRSQAVWKAGTLNPCLCLHLLSQHERALSLLLQWKLNDGQEGRVTISALYMVSFFLVIWLLNSWLFSSVRN